MDVSWITDHSSVEYVYYRYLLNKLAKVNPSQQQIPKPETPSSPSTTTVPVPVPAPVPSPSHSSNKSSIPALSHAMSVDPPSDDNSNHNNNNNNNKSKIPRRSRFRSRQPSEMARSDASPSDKRHRRERSLERSQKSEESDHDKHRPRFREGNTEEQEDNEDHILAGVLAGHPDSENQHEDLAKMDAYVDSLHQKEQEKLKSIDRRKTNVNHPGHHIGDFLPNSALVEFRARADNQRSQHRADGNKPWDPSPEDDEYTLYKKRMMLAYRHRPNPLVNFTKDKALDYHN
ncbi:hypothetical protein RFI_38687 [Reticulomyxa filosa]|uniref:Uncharacterized protein n=1 Tax=Reticulomyxa filosa TaxID=46433 RepID=X6LBR0_RETFI|nr:hypothetical protein RFI_38687 [Reticulomyxa filosa]|eukprot:ETN98800.1 hypothetical protein RFI_38687 [Reticulomyxa filosa]